MQWYNGIIVLVLLLVGEGVPCRWLLLLLHLAAIFLLPSLARLIGGPGFTWRSCGSRMLIAAIFLPLVFSETGLLLPAVNPEPMEWYAIVADRWLLGCDVHDFTAPLLVGYFPDILVLCYASFYFLPMILMLVLYRKNRLGEARQLLLAVTFGFAVSYLCYLVMPVLLPAMSLSLTDPAGGGAIFQFVNHTIISLEANDRDCFPSGHTWLTLTVMHLAWGFERRLFFIMLPLCAGLLLATITLHYHFLLDVIVGALVYWPVLRLALWLDKEGSEWVT